MQSLARYEGEVEMAAAARAVAQSDDEWTLHDQAWAALKTAAAHALLALRWQGTAAEDQQAAIQPRATDEVKAQALRSAAIAANHAKAAEEWGDRGAEFGLKARQAAASQIVSAVGTAAGEAPA